MNTTLIHDRNLSRKSVKAILAFSCSCAWMLGSGLCYSAQAQVEPLGENDFTAPKSLTGAVARSGKAAPNPNNLFMPVSAPHAVKIGIYDGQGAGTEGIEDVTQVTKLLPSATIESIPAEDFATSDLSKFDILIFPGGSGMSQSEGLGEKGRDAVRKFVNDGGSFLGICAGAHLANCGFKWTLGLINAHTVSPQWKRGMAFLQVELTEQGDEIFGNVGTPFYMRYYNGPIVKPAEMKDLPPYTIHAYFRTEVSQNNTPVGIQVDTPAVISASYGKGKVMTISPHPEKTKGTENFIPHALVWLSKKEATPNRDDEAMKEERATKVHLKAK